MNTAFGWLGQIIETALSFFPQLMIVRNTHEAVKWKVFGRVVAVSGGRRTWYWPLVTDIDTIVVARQTSDLPTQVLMTKDRESVVVGAMVVFWINDVVKAIGEKNWDVESVVLDITKAVVVEEVMGRTLDELLTSQAEGRQGDFCKQLTANCRKQLAPFGVHVHRATLTDFSKCRVHKILGSDWRTAEE